MLASVGEQIRDAHDMLTRQGVKTTLEWNSGNHFKEVDIRTAKAFAWAMNEGRGT